MCSSGSLECINAYGATYAIWVDRWIDYADVCWDFGACYDADPFYRISLGGSYEFTSDTNFDTGNTTWWDDPAYLQIDGNQSMFIRMEDEDISSHDWILTWGPKNNQGQFIAPPFEMLHAGGVDEDCWDGAGSGCYELSVRFVAQ